MLQNLLVSLTRYYRTSRESNARFAPQAAHSMSGKTICSDNRPNNSQMASHAFLHPESPSASYSKGHCFLDTAMASFFFTPSRAVTILEPVVGR
jgi:hypothetical protein